MSLFSLLMPARSLLVAPTLPTSWMEITGLALGSTERTEQPACTYPDNQTNHRILAINAKLMFLHKLHNTVILMKLLTTSLNTKFFATQNVVEKILQLRGTQFHQTLSCLLTFDTHKTYIFCLEMKSTFSNFLKCSMNTR